MANATMTIVMLFTTPPKYVENSPKCRVNAVAGCMLLLQAFGASAHTLAPHGLYKTPYTCICIYIYIYKDYNPSISVAVIPVKTLSNSPINVA